MGPNKCSLDDRRASPAGRYRTSACQGLQRQPVQSKQPAGGQFPCPATSAARRPEVAIWPVGSIRPLGRRKGKSTFVLHLTHMETIGVRELQQHASAALRRVEHGETIGVTDRGRLVAILAPASAATGAGALMAAGRVQPARRPPGDLPEPVTAEKRSDEVLNDLRGDR
jgi:antitoxin (DNA-binding transcriptional repressor) of toxin-antitoxin stability system